MKRIAFFVLLSLVFILLVSCDSNGKIKDNKPMQEEDKGFISINVPEPPLRHSSQRALTNADASTLYDDYYLFVISGNNANKIRYSSRPEGFNKIPLDVGEYDLCLIATLEGQVVGIAFTDSVSVVQYSVTEVDIALRAVSFDYTLNSECYMNSSVNIAVDSSLFKLLDLVRNTTLMMYYNIYKANGEIVYSSSFKYVFGQGSVFTGSHETVDTYEKMVERIDSYDDGTFIVVQSAPYMYYVKDSSLITDPERPEDAFVPADSIPAVSNLDILMPSEAGEYYIDFMYELNSAGPNTLFSRMSNVTDTPFALVKEGNSSLLNNNYRLPITVTEPPTGISLNVTWAADN